MTSQCRSHAFVVTYSMSSHSRSHTVVVKHSTSSYCLKRAEIITKSFSHFIYCPIVGISKCAHIQLTIVAVNRCSYRSVKGLTNQSTTLEVGPPGEDSNEYNSCFSLTSLRLPRRASLTTRLFVRQSSRRRRDRRLSLSD